LLAQARVASNTIPVIEDKHHTIYQERVDLLTGQVVARMDKRERNKLAKAA
jgi:hypothetical protein